MNNLNPLYVLQEMKQRLMKKVIKTMTPESVKAAGGKIGRNTRRVVNNIKLDDDGNVMGRIGDLQRRVTATKKGRALTADMTGLTDNPHMQRWVNG